MSLIPSDGFIEPEPNPNLLVFLSFFFQPKKIHILEK